MLLNTPVTLTEEDGHPIVFTMGATIQRRDRGQVLVVSQGSTYFVTQPFEAVVAAFAHAMSGDRHHSNHTIDPFNLHVEKEPTDEAVAR